MLGFSTGSKHIDADPPPESAQSRNEDSPAVSFLRNATQTKSQPNKPQTPWQPSTHSENLENDDDGQDNPRTSFPEGEPDAITEPPEEIVVPVPVTKKPAFLKRVFNYTFKKFKFKPSLFDILKTAYSDRLDNIEDGDDLTRWLSKQISKTQTNDKGEAFLKNSSSGNTIIATAAQINLARKQRLTLDDALKMAVLVNLNSEMVAKGVTLEGSPQEQAVLQVALRAVNPAIAIHNEVDLAPEIQEKFKAQYASVMKENGTIDFAKLTGSESPKADIKQDQNHAAAATMQAQPG